MKAIRLYRHPECERCAGYARMHHRFDWLGRFEDTTETPPTGPLRVGKIAVQDLRTGSRALQCSPPILRYSGPQLAVPDIRA